MFNAEHYRFQKSIKKYYLSLSFLNRFLLNMQFVRTWLFIMLLILIYAVGATTSDEPLLPEEQSNQREKVERVLIHLKNVPQGSKAIPGSHGVVTLEHRRFSEESQTLDAMATFYDVPVHPFYTVTGRHKSSSLAFDNPTELWGIWKDVEISAVKNELSFVRKMPYILDVKASFLRNNHANPSLQQGEELSLDVLLRNPSPENYKTSVVLLLKNMETGKITRLEKDLLLNANEQRGHAHFRFVAEEAGEHHFASGVFLKQRINEWTDCWDWSEDPMFFVTTRHRTIEFSGYTWDVKAGFGNPGGNLWSNDSADIWVDDKERLHLSLSKKENGRWYATEVISQQTFDYGVFTFYLDADPAEYDPHVVAGVFLYRNEASEIDLEFSRWGDKENYQFGNYVIQPADFPGNQFRFPLLTSGTYTTHRIVWKPDEILFSSWHGHWEEAPEGKIIAQWEYAGNHIPKSNGLRLFFNMWLFKGIAPKSDKTERLIINRFTYQPLSQLPVKLPDED